MNNEPRQALREIVAKFGTEICSDSRRCEGLLKDKCGSFRREISILINALDERVPLDLLAGGNSLPRELLLNRLAKRLEDNLALTENAAVWAVETWALALNLITDPEVAERANERTKNQAKNTDFDSEYQIRERDDKNLPPKPAPQKQPSPNQPQLPPFAPPPNPLPRINVPNQTPPAQIPTHPAPRAHTAPQSSQAQTPSPQIFPRKRGLRLRGCFVGCFLMLILLGILAVGVPYTFRVMREAQESVPPPRVPQQ